MDNNDPYSSALINDDPYEAAKVGQIPKAENLLQRAIKTAGSFGKGMESFQQGFTDAYTLGGAKLARNFGDKLADKITGYSPSPQEVEKRNEVNPIAYGVGASLPIVEGGVKLAKGIGGLFDVAGAKRSMSDVIQNSAKRVAGKIEESSHLANKAMGESLSKLEQTGISQEQFNDALRKTAESIDPTGSTHAMPGTLANKVLSMIEPVGESSDAVGMPASNMTGSQVQAKMVQIADALKHPVAKAEFWNQFSKILPETMKNIKSSRAGVYSAAEAAKPLTKIGTLNKIAKNSIGPQQLEELKSAEKGIGTNTIQDLIKAGNKVNKARTAQNIGKMVAKGTGIVGIEELLRHLWNR